MTIIDLSQPIFTNMPVYKGHPEVNVSPVIFHKEPFHGQQIASVNALAMGEHSGTHVDALSHMMPENAALTVDKMPLDTFYHTRHLSGFLP